MIKLGNTTINKIYLGNTEIKKVYLGNTLIVGGGTPSSLNPQLLNFNIQEAQPTRVYFDSSKIIQVGVNGAVGFTISGKTITGITIQSGLTTGHYFTVSVAFDFWDNNTIRYEGGSDLTDLDSNPLFDFYLTNVVNNISEPIPTSERYVTTTGNDANGGTNDTTDAWRTIDKAFQSSANGQKVWIKAGNYGSEIIYVALKNGTATAPRWVEGYKTTTGDITSMYYTYGDGAFNSSEMPYLAGGDRTSGRALQLQNSNFWIIKNLQISDYQDGIIGSGTSGNKSIILDNILIKDIGNPDVAVQSTGILLGESGITSNIRVLNYTGINCVGTVVRLYGGFNLINNCKTYNDFNTGIYAGTDYYLSIYEASNSQILNSLAHRVIDDEHGGHGCEIKGNGVISEYNLFENIVTININQGVGFRHSNVKYNVARNVECYETVVGSKNGHGLVFRDATSYNTVINSNIHDMSNAIGFLDNGGEQGSQNGGDFNKVINTIFKDNGTFIKSDQFGGHVGTFVNTNNLFINATVSNSSNLFNTQLLMEFDNTNKLINCILDTVTTEKTNTGINDFVYEYSDFWNSFTMPAGTGNISVDPIFSPFPDATNVLLQVGTPIADVNYDYYGNQRSLTTPTIGVVEIDGNEVIPTVYIALSGDNTDGLTNATAWNNLASVQADAVNWVAGDIIGFNGGDEFYGNLTLNNVNGANGNPITLTSYGSGTANLIGTKKITGWSLFSANVYAIDIDIADKVYQVFNGKDLQHNASIPIVTDIYATFDNFYSITSGSGTTYISTDLIGKPDLVGAKLHYTINAWTFNIAEIIAFNSVTGEFTVDQSITFGNPTSKLFFINNNVNLLASQGDWYYDDANNKLYMYSSTLPANIEISYADNTGILVYLSDYITIDNLDVSGYVNYGIQNSQSNSMTVENTTIKNNLGVNIKTESTSSNTTINNIITSQCDISGIASYGANDIITNNTSFDIGTLFGRSWTDRGQSASYGIGIEIYNGSTTRYNTVYNTGSTGIRFMTGISLIEYNFVRDFALNVHDVGGIYNHKTLIGDVGADGSNVNTNIVIGNVFSKDKWGDHCIYFDGTGNDIHAYNNTSINASTGIKFRSRINSNVTYNKVFNSRDVSFEYLYTVASMEEPNNNIVTNNDMLLFNTKQGSMSLENYITSTFAWGIVDNNQYLNLSNYREATLYTTTIKEDNTLADWRISTGFDLNTIEDAILLEQYPVSSIIDQKITNSDFEIDVSGWSGWQNTFTQGIDSGNYLKATLTGSSGTVKSNNFAVVAGTTYLIKFDIKKDIDGAYDLQFSVKNAGGNDFDYYVRPNSNWRTYAFKWTCESTNSTEWLEWFYNTADGNELHLDNVYFDEVIFDTTERIEIIYNIEKTAQNVAIPTGTWYDINGNLKTGTELLQPFESLMLINQSIK